jgi:hypothetical protein
LKRYIDTEGQTDLIRFAFLAGSWLFRGIFWLWIQRNIFWIFILCPSSSRPDRSTSVDNQRGRKQLQKVVTKWIGDLPRVPIVLISIRFQAKKTGHAQIMRNSGINTAWPV